MDGPSSFHALAGYVEFCPTAFISVNSIRGGRNAKSQENRQGRADGRPQSTAMWDPGQRRKILAVAAREHLSCPEVRKRFGVTTVTYYVLA